MFADSAQGERTRLTKEGVRTMERRRSRKLHEISIPTYKDGWVKSGCFFMGNFLRRILRRIVGGYIRKRWNTNQGSYGTVGACDTKKNRWVLLSLENIQSANIIWSSFTVALAVK